VKAALEGLRAETAEARAAALAFGRAGVYAGSEEDYLERQLLAVTAGLTADKNLLLAAQRAQRIARASNNRYLPLDLSSERSRLRVSCLLHGDALSVC